MVTIGVILLLTVIFVWLSKSISIVIKRENTVVDTTKLEAINDSILFHKNIVVIYRDSLNNEIQKIDYISNDSAIKLFRELVNE